MRFGLFTHSVDKSSCDRLLVGLNWQLVRTVQHQNWNPNIMSRQVGIVNPGLVVDSIAIALNNDYPLPEIIEIGVSAKWPDIDCFDEDVCHCWCIRSDGWTESLN